ncbi:hypothetical protein GUJ93_ZPchr0012g20377 [Zizania palustris]|uniref:Uncharacterized protein n=1 Tax=Zizania palustris TaxID=103762 RepID=A0A8J6BVF7_ZIZPA|nr:hypothetical protein GUJ93_ZPchr0012g20377 [Zizania palustris]
MRRWELLEAMIALQHHVEKERPFEDPSGIYLESSRYGPSALATGTCYCLEVQIFIKRITGGDRYDAVIDITLWNSMWIAQQIVY